MNETELADGWVLKEYDNSEWPAFAEKGDYTVEISKERGLEIDWAYEEKTCVYVPMHVIRALMATPTEGEERGNV